MGFLYGEGIGVGGRSHVIYDGTCSGHMVPHPSVNRMTDRQTRLKTLPSPTSLADGKYRISHGTLL